MEHLSNKRKLSIMGAILAAMFFAAINQTIIGVAMPRIIAKLGGMEYYTWVITIFMLTSTVATILVGKLSDMYGRKPFLMVGIGIFMAGAFLCGLSTNIYELIIYRGIQGLGAGIIMSLAFTAVGDLYAPRERARWTGVMSGVFGLSSVFGPALGGYIVDHLDWHWVFWIFLPLGIVAFFMIAVLFPKVERRAGETVDYTGSAVLTVIIVSLLLAFSWAGQGKDQFAWTSWQILGLFGISAVATVIFIFVESRAKNPVLPLSLFKNSVVTVSNMVGFFMNMGMMGAIIYVPFFVQGAKGISPTLSGYVTMPMSVAMIVTMAISGQIIAKTGKYKKMALAGLVIMTVGMTLLHYMNVDTSIYLTSLYMCIMGLGLGMSMPVFSLTVQNAVEPKMLGVVTASSQLFRSLGGTIGIAVMGTVMASRLVSKMQELMSPAETGAALAQIDPAIAAQMQQFLDPQELMDQPKLAEFQSQLPADLLVLFNRIVESLRESLSYAVTSTFLAGSIVTLVAIVLTLFLKELPLRSAKDKDHQPAVGQSASDEPGSSRRIRPGTES